jgi:predicted amidohydrolase
MFIANQQIVAAVQMQPVLLQPEINLQMAQQLVFEAASKGAKLIVLPELALTGYNIQNIREASEVAQTKDGWLTQAILELATSLDCYIIFGYIELYEGNYYNAAAVVGPTGLQGNFRKHNLFGSDNLWAKAAEDMFATVITPAGRTGVMICRDAMNNYRQSYKFYNPNAKFYRKGSIDTLALLTAWGEKFGYPDSAWLELAEELDCNVIVANRVGQERDMLYKGGSAIIDRNKKLWTFGSSFTDPCVVGGVVIL